MPLAFGKLFAPKRVDNAAADTLLTVPVSPSSSILRNGIIRFTNTTAGFVTIKAWLVPTAGSATDSNCFLPATSVGVNGYIDVKVPVGAAGDTVQAQAGAANSITASFIDGFIQT